MTSQEKAMELIEKVKKATTYKYQEYAGANYSTFEHDIDVLRSLALILVEEISDESGMVYHTDGTLNYWNEVKNELEKITP